MQAHFDFIYFILKDFFTYVCTCLRVCVCVYVCMGLCVCRGVYATCMDASRGQKRISGPVEQ